MTHFTKRPPRQSGREPTATASKTDKKKEYHCAIGEHDFSLEEADYCDDCGQFVCPRHGHECIWNGLG